MKRNTFFFLAFLLAAPPSPADDSKPPSLLGDVTRDQVEQAEPDWVAAEVEAEIDVEAARGLTAVEAGEIRVFFGTWCSDSKRELPRFWRALDEAGMVSFTVDYVAVDRADQRPPELAEEHDLLYVPTFIVRRDGREVGRVVESSPDGIERDLLALLRGTKSGVVSGRDDLGSGGSDDSAATGDRSIDVTGSRTRGEPGAPLTLVELGFYQCAGCAKSVRETLPYVSRDYVKTGKVELVFMDLPTSGRRSAVTASEAAHCAGEQDRYWQYHDQLFYNFPAVETGHLAGYARNLGLDLATWKRCIDSGRYRPLIEGNLERAAALGIRATPTFVIGRREAPDGPVRVLEVFQGAQPLEVFREKLDGWLARNAD